MKKVLFLALALILTASLFAEVPSYAGIKSFGGSGTPVGIGAEVGLNTKTVVTPYLAGGYIFDNGGFAIAGLNYQLPIFSTRVLPFVFMGFGGFTQAVTDTTTGYVYNPRKGRYNGNYVESEYDTNVGGFLYEVGIGGYAGHMLTKLGYTLSYCQGSVGHGVNIVIGGSW